MTFGDRLVFVMQKRALILAGVIVGICTAWALFTLGIHRLVGSGGAKVEGPAGFHAACFDINGRPFVNAIGTAWEGDLAGVFTITMDGGLKATMHGDRCLVEEMSPAQWAEVHKPALPVSASAPAVPVQKSDAGPVAPKK